MCVCVRACGCGSIDRCLLLRGFTFTFGVLVGRFWSCGKVWRGGRELSPGPWWVVAGRVTGGAVRRVWRGGR